MADSIKISIELADAAAQKALSEFNSKSIQADTSLKKLSESGKSTFSEISVGIQKSSGIFDIFAGNIAANVVVGAFNVMKDASGALFKTFIEDGVKSAQAEEDAINSMNVALGQSGIYSKETSKYFVDLANHMQDITTYGNDVIEKNIALLESMTHLDKEGLARATKAAIQLSAAYNIDLETATKSVAKAAEGHVAALQKQGLQFEIAGTQAGTFENALTAIETLNGSAESKLNTYSGALQHTANSFDDLTKAVGQAIVLNPAIVAAINKVSEILDNATGFLSENSQAMKSLVAEGFITLINGTKYVVQAFDVMISAVRIVFNSLESVVEQTVAAVLGPLAFFSEEITNVWNAFRDQAADSAATVSKIFENGGSLTKVTKALDDIGNAAKTGFDKLGKGADASVPKIKNAKKSLDSFNDEVERGKKQLNDYVTALAHQNDDVKKQYDFQLKTIENFYKQKEATDSKEESLNFQLKLERETSYFNERESLLNKNLQFEMNKIAQAKLNDDTKHKALLEAQRKYNEDYLALETEHKENLKKLDELVIKDRDNTLSRISTLSHSKSREMAAIGKAAALTKIAMEIPVAWTEAYTWGTALGGPILGAVFGSIAEAALAGQAAQVAGISFESGGIVPGASFYGDKVSANVNSGEMILNRTQQTELFKIANGQGSSDNRELIAEIRALRSDMLKQPINVQVDGRTIFNGVRNQLNSGRVFV